MPRAYRTYSTSERQHILAAAVAEGLSAKDVQRRFGVNPHTYYVWRRRSGLRGPRGRRPVPAASKSTHASKVLQPAAEREISSE